MVEKCCETCSRYKDCGLTYCCTYYPVLNIPEDKRDVRVSDVGLHKPADFWNEGEDVENLLYRIKRLEDKLSGV